MIIWQILRINKKRGEKMEYEYQDGYMVYLMEKEKKRSHWVKDSAKGLYDESALGLVV